MKIKVFPLSHSLIIPTDDPKLLLRDLKMHYAESLIYTHTCENTSVPWAVYSYAWFCFSFKNIEFSI